MGSSGYNGRLNEDLLTAMAELWPDEGKLFLGAGDLTRKQFDAAYGEESKEVPQRMAESGVVGALKLGSPAMSEMLAEEARYIVR